MVGSGAVEELIRVLPIIVGWRRLHVAVEIAVILLASGPTYRL